MLGLKDMKDTLVFSNVNFPSFISGVAWTHLKPLLNLQESFENNVHVLQEEKAAE